MKKFLLVALVALLSACQGVPVYNAKAYKDDKTQPQAVIFENDKGIAVREADGSITPYVYYSGVAPGPGVADKWFNDNFVVKVIDEREAKALNTLMLGGTLDIATSKFKFKQGCIEGNQLFKSQNLVAMVGVKFAFIGLEGYLAKQSTVYQSTLRNEPKYIYGSAVPQYLVAAKNLLVKC